MSCRSAREPVWGLELTTAKFGEPATEPGLSTVKNLEKYNSKGGEVVPVKWSLEKQADSDIRVRLGGIGLVANMVGWWAVCFGWLLVWWIGRVVGLKFEEGFKVGKCVGYIGWEKVIGCCAIYSDFVKENIISWKWTWWEA